MFNVNIEVVAKICVFLGVFLILWSIYQARQRANFFKKLIDFLENSGIKVEQKSIGDFFLGIYGYNIFYEGGSFGFSSSTACGRKTDFGRRSLI